MQQRDRQQDFNNFERKQTMSKRFESSIQARIPTRIVKELEQVAEARCQTMSGLVREFLVRGLKRARKSNERRQEKE